MKLINNKAILVFCICMYSSGIYSQVTPDFNVNKSIEEIGLANDPFKIIQGANKNKLNTLNQPFNRNRAFSNINILETTTNGSWSNTGPYGMGNCYTVCVEQSEGNVILAGTTRGIVRSTNGGNDWQLIGGFSTPWWPDGPISCIVQDPVNHNKFIAGDGTDQFMVVFISEDYGLTWTAINHPSSCMSIDISPTNHLKVISGSNSFMQQLAKSVDGGYTWSTLALSETVTGRVYSVKFHPSIENRVYAGGEQGLFYSEDFGATWNEINSGIPDLDYIDISSIEFSPTNSDSIVVTCSSAHGPYLSTNGGLTWNDIRSDLLSFELVWKAEYNNHSPNELYIGAFYNGLSRRSFPETNWQGITQLNQHDPGSIEDIVTLSNNNQFIASRNNGIYKSNNGGVTYQLSVNGASCADIHSVSMFHNNPGIAISGGWTGGIFKTIDKGVTWHQKFVGGDINSVDISTNNTVCFAGGGSIPIIKSTDAGETWQPAYNGIPYLNQIIKIKIDPENPNHIIALKHYPPSDITVYQTFDQGNSWQPAAGIPATASAYYVHEILFDYQSSTPHIYIGTDNGLFYSIDNGINWSQCYASSPKSLGITINNGVPVIYGISVNSVYYSSDNGFSWLEWYTVPGNELLHCKINENNSLEVITIDLAPNCLYSNDGGLNWFVQNQGLPYETSSEIDVDFTSKTRYLSTRGQSVFCWNDSTSYIVTISADPQAGGNVSGEGTYLNYQYVTIQALPNQSFNFINWTENDSIISTNSSYSFNIFQDHNFIAHFDTATYTITAQIDPPGAGNVTGTGAYVYGSNATLIASAATGYEFLNWTENGNIISIDSIMSMTITSNHQLIANFSPHSYSIDVIIIPPEGGTTTGTGSYDYGQTAVLVALPNPGYNFMNWSENGSIVSTNPTYEFTVFGARTLTVNFISETYTISTVIDPQNSGYTTGSGVYYFGETATMIAVPFPNYEFVDWKENDIVLCIDSIYSFNVVDNRVLLASFKLITGSDKPLDEVHCYIYPIPAKNELFIQLNREYFSKTDKISAQIFNNIGISISSEVTEVDNNLNLIDISNIYPGFYVIQIKANDEYFNRKILIIK